MKNPISVVRNNLAYNSVAAKAFCNYLSHRHGTVVNFLNLFINLNYKMYKKLTVSRVNNKNDFDVKSVKPSEKTNKVLRVSATEPMNEEWDQVTRNFLNQSSITSSNVVDIIIPVYSGRAETLRCIYSVLSVKNKTQYNLILINDCSPDSELVKAIENIASRFDQVSLYHNKENKGFVKTTNFGMTLHTDRDVVWLNSDTEVFDGWLDRLVAISLQNPQIATITPLSNNATICSYPLFNEDNCQPLKHSDAVIDELAYSINKLDYEVAPTGVGFCMFVRREALNQVGYLDESHFSRGYGEENDLCCRFKDAGWLNVIATGIFVRHYGGVSFKHESLVRKENAIKVLSSLHPYYLQEVADFCKVDPMRIYRIKLDAARLAQTYPANDKKRILFITHSLGGGTETFVQDIITMLGGEKITSYVLRSRNDSSSFVDCDPFNYPNLQWINSANDYEALEAILRSLRVTDIHIDHLINFDSRFYSMIIDISKKLGIVMNMTIHDYFPICPFITMLPSEKCMTGPVCTLNDCQKCLKRHDLTESAWYRSLLFGKVLSACKKITVPSCFVARRLEHNYPNVKFDVIYHREKYEGQFLSECQLQKMREKTLVLGVVGAIGEHKGFEVLLKMGKYIMEHKLPIQMKLCGYSMDDDRLKKVGWKISGRYKSENDAQTWLKEEGVNAILIPSIWPETYCYTLSIALRSGAPVFAFNIGAQAERLRALGYSSHLLSLTLKNKPEKLVEKINSIRLNYRQHKNIKSCAPKLSDYFGGWN